MPSTRGLAKQYALARGTVAAAFEQLKIEGYVETTVGAGTFVSARLPDESVAIPSGPPDLAVEQSNAGSHCAASPL